MTITPFFPIASFFEASGSSFDAPGFLARERLPWRVWEHVLPANLKGKMVMWSIDDFHNLPVKEQVAFAIDFLEHNGPLLERLSEQTDIRMIGIQDNFRLREAFTGELLQFLTS